MEKNITIRIQNFRSLKDVTLNLSDVNLFIGPNNSGKTNVFKALEFLGEWLRTGNVKNFQDNYFGKKKMAYPYDGNIDEPLSFTFQTNKNDNVFYIYQIEFFYNNAAQRYFVNQLVGITNFDFIKKDFIKNFNLKIVDIKSYESWFYEYEIYADDFPEYYLQKLDDNIKQIIANRRHWSVKKENIIPNIITGKVSDAKYFLEQSDLAKATLFNFFRRNTLEKIDGFYSVKVEKLKLEAHYQSSTKVSYDASNLVSFIDDMDNNYPQVLEDIKRNFKACIGNEFINFKCPVFSNNGEGVKRKLKFFDVEGNSYWADEVSEGVLYFLALVCILHQPEPPKFLLLEEPENGIHPRRISNIIEYIFELAEQKNITVIMTTHSPVLLDEFKDIPENVFIFDKNEQNKASEVTQLNDFITSFNQKASKKGLPTLKINGDLSSYWLTGLINGVPKI